MRVANSSLVRPFLLLIALTGLFSTSYSQESSKEILRRVLKGQRNVDYLHIEARSFGGGSATAKVKVQTVVGEGVMVTILEPINSANIVTVDDARFSKTYFPDQNQLLVQPSPFLLQPDFDLRWKLINENYTLKLGEWEKIANQRVREFILVPNEEDVPVRRMFIDQRHYVTLKYVVDEEGEESVVFDTKYVDFGREAASAGFGLPTGASLAKKIQVKGPKQLFEPGDSREGAGFSFRLPEDLPYGFAVSGSYLFGGSKDPYVGVKLTDGMATLTVYQWRKGRSKTPPDARLVAFDRYGVGYGIGVVPGDFMPDQVLERIVAAFNRG